MILGIAGAEYGIRGFIEAFDAATGKKLWRFYTVAGPEEFGRACWPRTDYLRGGGSVWVTGTYDPEQNLVFFGTGNPGPDYYSANREGDNLFTASIVALDADTGKLGGTINSRRTTCTTGTPGAGAGRAADRWKAPQGGDVRQSQRVLLHHRSRHRKTRQAVRRDDVGQGDRQHHRPADSAAGESPERAGARTCPDLGGGTNFMSPSYDPAPPVLRHRARDVRDVYAFDQEFKVGVQYMAGGTVRPATSATSGAARDRSGDGGTQWEFRYPTTSASGVLSTASGLVFAGDGDGNLMAFESRTGKNLWHYQLGSARSTSGTTYMLDGRQYCRGRRQHADRVRVAARD